MLTVTVALLCSAMLVAPARRSPDNYVAEVVRARDGVVMRWVRSPETPIRIFVSRSSDAGGLASAYAERRVRAAFRTWENAVPVRFQFVDDSETADASVWIVEQLEDQEFGDHVNGLTHWTVDDSSRIVSATIRLALRRSSGGRLEPHAIEAMALHEIGHLLGLGHTGRPLNIMSPTVEVRGLSPADRKTVRLLYGLPTGVLRL